MSVRTAWDVLTAPALLCCRSCAYCCGCGCASYCTDAAVPPAVAAPTDAQLLGRNDGVEVDGFAVGFGEGLPCDGRCVGR